MARKKAKSVKPKFSAEVAEIFSQLKNDGVKLSMLQEAALVKKLSMKHSIKPAVIQKQMKMSLPHVYNLINLASMSPRMKAYVMSGKLKGTDALSLMRKAKDEKEFIKLAEQLISNKVDRRLKTNRDTTKDTKKEVATGETKRGRGRPKKEQAPVVVTVEKRKPGRPKKQEESVVTTDNVSARKEKIKNLILNFLGKKASKVQNKSLNELVETLIANN